MELEDAYIVGQQQYSSQIDQPNIIHKGGYVSYGLNHNQEILQPYEYNDDYMQMEFNDNNFLFVDQDNHQQTPFLNHSTSNSANYNSKPDEYNNHNYTQSNGDNIFNSNSQLIFTSRNSLSHHSEMVNQDMKSDMFYQLGRNNDYSDLSHSQSLSHTDCTSQHSKEGCPEFLAQEKMCNIVTQKQGMASKDKNNKFVVKSIVAVDVEKQPGNFVFKYGERPYVVVNPLQGFYFISGDVCIINTLLSKDFNRYSELNSFKAPVKTYSNMQTGALQVDVNNKRNGLKNFGFLIEKLRSYNNQKTFDFSNLLEKYQGVINDLQEKKSLLKDEQSMNFYTNFLEDSYVKFQEKVAKILGNVAQTCTFYSYSIHRLNLFNFEMEMRKFGYSEALLALLGLDVVQAQQYIWRKGLFDYLDKQNIEKLLYLLVSHKLGNTENYPFDVCLHTFDNLDVYAVNNVQIYMNKDPNNPFLPYNEILLVSVYDVSPTMIKQVMEIRKLTKEKSVKYLRDQEEDLSYSMEATIFLEKYYKTASQNFLPSNKRAGYRAVNQQQQQQPISEQTVS